MKRRSPLQIHPNQMDIFKSTSLPGVHVQDVEFYHHPVCDGVMSRVAASDEVYISNCNECGMTVESTLPREYVYYDECEENGLGPDLR